MQSHSQLSRTSAQNAEDGKVSEARVWVYRMRRIESNGTEKIRPVWFCAKGDVPLI